MGPPPALAAVTEAWVKMLQAPPRPAAGAWWAEREPWLRRLERKGFRLEVNEADRRGLLRHEAALLVDRLLAPVARGRGALDLALGEGLGQLSVGDRALRLGYASIGDYAREELGLPPRTAQAMAQLSRELHQTPLLREAVLRGEVSASKARTIVRVAFGENEAAWVERARAETVRALASAVRKERGEDEAEEDWDRVCLPLSAEERAEVDQALDLAGKVTGTLPPRPQRLEALSQEFLSAYPDPMDEVEPGGGCCGGHGAAACGPGAGGAEAAASAAASQAGGDAAGAGGAEAGAPGSDGPARPGHAGSATGPAGPLGWSPPRGRSFLSWPVEDWLEAAKEGLEAETGRWEALGVLDPVAAPRAGEECHPQALDQELQGLMAMHRRWDELLGHLGLVMRFFGLWRELGFASFGHYCLERLWLAPRTVEQRVWLERRCYDLPGLREALRSGRLSYEQARLVAGAATPETLEDWVRKAESMTCIALRRSIGEEEDRQMSARDTLEVLLPARVADLLEAAFRAAQKKAGRPLTPGQCLVEISRHFIEVWKGAVKDRNTAERRARKRDQHCTVPGCSRLAAQAHHIVHVSRGGTDDPWNLTGVCAAHHLAIHQGWVRVSGRAPDHLVWELGEREEPPLDLDRPDAAA